jgi:hypothetical protein
MRTYIDSGVLITAARGNAALSTPAIEILSDASREFVSSEWVRLEVLVGLCAQFPPGLLAAAMEEAVQSGLSAVEAIHVVLAATSGCEELITSEKSTSAIHRTKRVRIVSIHP